MAEVVKPAKKRLSELEKAVAELKKALEASDQIVLASPNGKYRMSLRQDDDGGLIATLLVYKEGSQAWEPQGASGEGRKVLAAPSYDGIQKVFQLR